MTRRRIARLVQATALTEGAGVTVHRTIGTAALPHFDPFLMLDHFGSDEPNEYLAGFPAHPHRGFNTLTYMLDGHLQHRDSMGNEGDLQAGGIQWMKAGSGVIHAEMPQQTAGLMRGFQLWINLPAAQKMSAPAYQEFSPAAVPVAQHEAATVRVVAGSYADVSGPINDPHTDIRYLDVALAAGASFSLTLPSDLSAFIYVFEGRATIAAETVPGHALAVLTTGDHIELVATEALRFLLLAGRPINEPIVQYGPFVMNSREEIQRAFDDYHNGNLVRTRAQWISDKNISADGTQVDRVDK